MRVLMRVLKLKLYIITYNKEWFTRKLRYCAKLLCYNIEVNSCSYYQASVHTTDWTRAKHWAGSSEEMLYIGAHV